ncbi:M1 family aminopeptidase [Frigoriglobus tundricola]|uniref:Peptidase M1 membrane alanine aminopeptidase domain-containing protein n=1 Tax=Frigoriglobus tundricola TaxID=2774151 RepID=A0A6M5YKI5_9BACT|nr:M1 family aminopeptidase [Frigoriglobus tundricola]QJW93502.1 hypothetical protein FTUN_1008 [Frigoriglobus tundricola]
MDTILATILRQTLRFAVIFAAIFGGACGGAAAEVPHPANLPLYDLDIAFDFAPHRAVIRERVTWTNTTRNATDQLVFCFYPHYQVPSGDQLLFSKTYELMRLQPSLGIDRTGPMGSIKSVSTLPANGTQVLLKWSFEEKNMTTVRVTLPAPVAPGQAVTVELQCEVRLPNKQGRWGHYEGVTYLTNAIPLVAVCDDTGWKPNPFVPWHQPWFNEAGVFRTTITVPEGEKVACSAAIKGETKIDGGRKRVECEPFLGRDFAVLLSARYHEFTSTTKLPDGRTVALKCLAFPEHEFYATEILKMVGEAIPIYSQWFGAYPYSQFTVAESYFGWNGNECGGLVMIDERVFGMPHLARGYVEYLVSHETCHQWWYNMIGTNGYSEPFMDEGAATYFTHRMLNVKNGKNNRFLTWPKGLEWLPNIDRENYRYGSMYHAIRNGEMTPAAQDLPQYKHLFGLFTGAYDRGSKVFGMIEDRLGEAAFFDFISGLVKKYSWHILTVAQLRAELETYTGRDWSAFFDRWVYGTGLTDWSVDSVTVGINGGPQIRPWNRFATAATGTRYTTTVYVRQSREFTEPTVVAFTNGGTEIRVPVGPFAETVQLSQPKASVTPLGENRYRIDADLPFEPEQVTIDPDGVLLDANPGNNKWKTTVKARLTPLYTMLDETGLTTDYDRWNVVAGPWVWGPTAQDPWYTRATMLGVRAGAFRTESYALGAYTAIRSDYRDAVVGVDGRVMAAHSEFGANWETRIAGPVGGLAGQSGAERGSIYARHIWKESASLYLPPMLYDEFFLTYQDNFLPYSRTPGGERWSRLYMAGWHGRLNLYTPYWDPETGIWADAWAGGGQAEFNSWKGMGQASAQIAAVQQLPDWFGDYRPRIAARVFGQYATPTEGQFFALGGGTLFRGFDLAERQGSLLWVGNLELRLPLARNVTWDTLDHTVGARNVWLATFYDVGAVYAGSHAVGGNVAQAVGAGVRVDIAIFSFIERATLRFDVGKTINAATPLQFWFGVQQAF